MSENENGRHSEDPQIMLDQLADEVTERFRRGRKPRVGDYIRRYPQFADELERIFIAITSLHESRGDDAETFTNGEDNP